MNNREQERQIDKEIYRLAWAESLSTMTQNLKSLAFDLSAYGVIKPEEKSRLTSAIGALLDLAHEMKTTRLQPAEAPKSDLEGTKI